MKLEMGLKSYHRAHQKVDYFSFLCSTLCETFLTMEHNGVTERKGYTNHLLFTYPNSCYNVYNLSLVK
jgi:hypothetical protein